MGKLSQLLRQAIPSHQLEDSIPQILIDYFKSMNRL